MFDNIEEVKQKLQEMKSHYKGGFSSIEQEYLEDLYLRIFKKSMPRRIGCQDCYRDAFILISNAINSMNEMPKQSLYKLKAGVVAQTFGSSEFYVLDMPEEAAEKWLKDFPERIQLFQTYPEDWEERINARFAPQSKIDTAADGLSTEGVETASAKKRGRKKATL